MSDAGNQKFKGRFELNNCRLDNMHQHGNEVCKNYQAIEE